jgi:predicted amidohydrolase
MQDFVAGCCQLNVIPGEIQQNLRKAQYWVSEMAEGGCRLLVLPEMWSCSFSFLRLDEMAGATPMVLESLSAWSRQYQMVLVGSLPEKTGGSIFNTSYVIDGGRLAGSYRKIHLFSYNREHEYFEAGKVPLVCETRVGRLGIMICYDLRFPELARRLALDGAEILCVSAQWPVERLDHWSLLLRSRALENQMFVLGCNGCGAEDNLRYGGASALVSPTGSVLAEGGSEETGIRAALDPASMLAFRGQIPCFADRRSAAYGAF